MNWNTEKVSALLNTLAYKARYEKKTPGGDYDTSVITMKCPSAPGETLFIRGFRHSKALEDPDNAEIEMVEVEDGGDSRGGLNSSSTDFCVMYAKTVALLRQNGYNVVPSMDDYF